MRIGRVEGMILAPKRGAAYLQQSVLALLRAFLFLFFGGGREVERQGCSISATPPLPAQHRFKSWPQKSIRASPQPTELNACLCGAVAQHNTRQVTPDSSTQGTARVDPRECKRCCCLLSSSSHHGVHKTHPDSDTLDFRHPCGSTRARTPLPPRAPPRGSQGQLPEHQTRASTAGLA